MKGILLFCFMALTSTLFALGQTEEDTASLLMKEGAQPSEAYVVVGGFVEIDVSSCDPELFKFIMTNSIKEDAECLEDSENCVLPVVTEIKKQTVSGAKYLVNVELSGGNTLLLVILRDISGELTLLELHKNMEINEYLYPEAIFFKEKLQKN